MTLTFLASFCVTSLLVGHVTGVTSRDYAPCTGLAYIFNGYTFTFDAASGERVWSHCSFPSPFGDLIRCGRPRSDKKRFLCDPDHILDRVADVPLIDELLETIQKRTSVVCVNSAGIRETFRVAVALINRIYIPDMDSPDLCQNECGRLQPALNISRRIPTEEEQEEIMRLFADGIRSLWDIGSCGNDVIVLYCKEFHKVHVSSGSKASEYLTPEKVATLQTTFQTYISTHGTQGFVLGLENLLKSLKFTLKGITPAFILLMGNMAVLGVMTVVLFYYILGKRFETNIWEDDNCYWVWELFVKCSTGILWLEICVLVMAKISHSSRALFYVFLAAVLGLIFCTALHYVSRRIYYHE